MIVDTTQVVRLVCLFLFFFRGRVADFLFLKLSFVILPPEDIVKDVYLAVQEISVAARQQMSGPLWKPRQDCMPTI